MEVREKTLEGKGECTVDPAGIYIYGGEDFLVNVNLDALSVDTSSFFAAVDIKECKDDGDGEAEPPQSKKAKNNKGEEERQVILSK